MKRIAVGLVFLCVGAAQMKTRVADGLNQIQAGSMKADLSFLASDPGKVFTRRRILEDVWEMHWIGTTKTLDVHVASLRKKLGDPTWVETVRGVGFRLRPTP